MRDKTKVRDQISFVLNGKPVNQPTTLICPKCGVDRLKSPCPIPELVCPMKGKAL